MITFGLSLNMKTKAAILVELNKPLVVEDIDIPVLYDGQVLVRVLASGICRSQLNEYGGLKGPDPYLPHLLGHEGAGIVEATTSSVKKVKAGDYVVMTWIKGQGQDVAGSQYRWGKKTVNSGAIATLTEYAVVAENRVVKISKAVPPAEASLLGCAVPTGSGMVLNTLNVKKGTSLAVFGVGGIGAAAILAAKFSGCSTIVGVDVSERKLEFASELGATHGCKSGQSAKEFIKRVGKMDYVIESSGRKEAMELAYTWVKDTGTLVIAGNLSKGQKVAIDPFDLIKGKRIVGTWGGETVPDRDIPQYSRAYLRGDIPLTKLITHRFALKDINPAFAMLNSGRAGRVIIEF